MKTKYRLTLKIPERVTKMIIMMFRLIKFYSDKEKYDNLNRVGFTFYVSRLSDLSSTQPITASFKSSQSKTKKC